MELDNWMNLLEEPGSFRNCASEKYRFANTREESDPAKGKPSRVQEESQFILELRAHLLETWSAIGLSGSPSGLSYRIRQSTRGRILDRGRLVALWFRENPEMPEVVTKWTQTKAHFTQIIEEYKRVKELYDSKEPKLVPRPLGCHEIKGIPVLLEEAVIGRSFAHQVMSVPSDENMIKRIFTEAQALLGRIQGSILAVSPEDCLREFDPYLRRGKKLMRWDPGKLEEVKKKLRESIPNPVPGSGNTFLVGEYAPHNLLQGSNGVFLIDLEFSRHSVLAFLDSLSFVHGMLRFGVPDYPHKEPALAVAVFRENLFGEKNFFARAARDFLAAGGVSLPHLPWYWILYFLHEMVQQSLPDQPFPPGPRAFFETHIDSMMEVLHT